MDKFVIEGGHKLHGTIKISGAKNSAVAIIPAVLLCDEPCTIENLPRIRDVSIILKILESMGAKITRVGGDPSKVRIDPRGVTSSVVTCRELVGDMRASYYLLGALLGRFGKASVPPPGGCNFCERPIDLHIRAFRALGADCKLLPEYQPAEVRITSENLRGADIQFDVASVGATINAMLAAVKIPGTTRIRGAAREPHIVDLANFLNSMGAEVRGAGTDRIRIKGVERLHKCTFSIIPDQIEAGTYMTAVAAAGGDVTITGVTTEHLESIISKLRDAGVGVEVNTSNDSVRIIRDGLMTSCSISTAPHPGFPTDMQPQFAALLSIASGKSRIIENVWETRFSYRNELRKMGADIELIRDDTANIRGVPYLVGAKVKALDLRAGAAMVVAALAAKGETEISNISYIERGYEYMIEKLAGIGANIRRVTYVESTSIDEEF